MLRQVSVSPKEEDGGFTLVSPVPVHVPDPDLSAPVPVPVPVPAPMLPVAAMHRRRRGREGKRDENRPPHRETGKEKGPRGGMVISLDGNIGAGKTTAAEAVAVETGGAWFCEEGFDLMLEQVKADPKYWAALFQFHMFHCALATAVRAKRAFEASPTKIIVLDRSILGNRAFSAVQRRMGNIPEDVYAKYCQLVRDSREKAFIPDVVHVYCHATAQRCSRWIGERGRRGEENIPLEYLRMVERAHLGIIVSTLCTPGARSQVLVVDFELPVSHQQLLELVNAHAVHTATTETGIMPVIHPVSSHRGLDGISETDAVDIACSLPLERARACFHALTVKGYTENNMQIDLSMFYNDP